MSLELSTYFHILLYMLLENRPSVNMRQLREPIDLPMLSN